MENYEVVSKLGRGAQGSVFIVKRLDDGKQYILKKVECNDEAEANKAFQEAMALQELQHRFICGYKEFFVMWDEEVATMFVCIVMEYYKNGDLDNVLKRRRVSQQPIEELILKKWLGQIIEALAFVHQKQIIHRDLKPSNIFMKEDLSISIGDFGVATIMGDTRTKTRTVIGSLNWLAPEVTDRPYDERSDIWSVGCITLEMATCGIYDRIQMGDQLCKIKKNSKDLDESLEEIQKTYSSELCDVIRRMLSLDVEERPTAMELVDMPYVRESLSISASPLVNFKKADLTDIKKNPLPKDKGCAGVLEYIESNFQSENCVREALSHLEEMSRSTARSSIGNDAKRLIVKSMRSHRKSEMVQILGCKTLNNLIVGAADSDILFSREIIAIVPLAMRSHSNSTDLLLAAVTLIIALSSDEKASETIGRCGGIQDILSAIRSHPSQSELLTQCCKALWSLTVSEPNAKIVTEEKGLPDLVNIMKLHSGNTDAVAAAAAAMLSLFMEDENLKLVSELECVTHLMTAVQTHIKHAKVVKNACMALTCLVEPDEESAYKVLNNPQADGTAIAGIPIIISAYHQHKDNADVVENICSLFMELSEYKDIFSEMEDLKCEKVLADVMRRFKENRDIMIPCQATLAKFSHNE